MPWDNHFLSSASEESLSSLLTWSCIHRDIW